MTLDVSRILDGDVTSEELAAKLDALSRDPDQRDRCTRYVLIGDGLRGNSTPDDGFSVRIFERMRAQGITIEPGYDPLAD
jgi:negative regulator of sigma E activity